MVWGCILVSGVGDLVKIDGIVNNQILVHHAIPSGKHLINNSIIFSRKIIPNTLIMQ